MLERINRYTRAAAVRGGAIALVSALAVSPVLAGCTPQDADPGSGSNQQQEAPTPKSPRQRASEQFAAALSDPKAYFPDLDPSIMESASFSYALVDMDGSGVPAMLLRASGPADTWNGVDSVRVLAYNPDGDEATACEGKLTQGVAASGGYRGTLSATSSGTGLIYEEVSSGTGEATAYRIVIDGAALAQTVAHSGTVGADSPCGTLLSGDRRDIAWTDAGDPGLLEDLLEGDGEPAAGSAVDWAAKAAESGLAVYSGTVHVLDADGLASLQGKENPNAGYEDEATYVVLSLDAPQTVTANSGDGSGARDGQAALIALEPAPSGSGTPTAWYPDYWKPLDGQQATVAVNPAGLWWPSDASLPLGEPRCRDFLVLA